MVDGAMWLLLMMPSLSKREEITGHKVMVPHTTDCMRWTQITVIDAQTRMFALNSYWFLTSITYTRARHANSNYTSTAAITQLSQRCKLERNQDIAV